MCWKQLQYEEKSKYFKANCEMKRRDIIRKYSFVKYEYAFGKCDLTYSVEQKIELLHKTKIT